MRPTCALAAALSLATVFSCADDSAGAKDRSKLARGPRPTVAAAPASSPAPVAPAPTATPLGGGPVVAYPESAEGLGILAQDLLAAAHGDDDVTLARLLESLRLRDPELWFETTFGKTLGRELVIEYQLVRDEIGQLGAVLDRIAGANQTKLTIERFDQADQPASVGYQSAALAKMARKSALYSVRFGSADGKRLFHLWSFIYQEGSFRFVGKMKRIIEAPGSGDHDLLERRLAEADRLRGGGR